MRVQRFYIGGATEGQAWFELRVTGFVMPRTCMAVPLSARAEAALLSGGKRKTTMGRALEWLSVQMYRRQRDILHFCLLTEERLAPGECLIRVREPFHPSRTLKTCKRVGQFADPRLGREDQHAKSFPSGDFSDSRIYT